jgi:raffinose/stachyose/melibiose transport system substrate-binding protein
MFTKTTRRLLLAATATFGMAISFAVQAGEVTFWTWRQEDKAMYADLFAIFTKSHPGITVKFEAFPNENYNTIVSTALAGGKGADVLHVRAYGGLEAMAKAGYLVPLDAAKVPELKNLPADALASETLRSDGKVYAVSFAGQTVGILINKDLFASAGVAVPTNWADFLAAGRALKAKGITPIANGTATPWMDAVFHSAFTNPFLGPQFVTDLLAGNATFEDKRYVDATAHLLELRDMMPAGFTGVDYPTAQQLFSTGRAAMFVGGSFEIGPFRRANPKLNLDFIAPPAPAAGQPTYVSRWFDSGFAVNAKSTHSEDAMALVRWLATPEFAIPAAEKLGNISSLSNAPNPDPLLGKVAELNKTAMPYIMLVYFRYEAPTGSDLLQDGVQKMMAGTMTPAEVGKMVTDGVAKYYVPFQKK